MIPVNLIQIMLAEEFEARGAQRLLIRRHLTGVP
jgi:hypothetical protein